MFAKSSCRPLRGFFQTNRTESPALADGAIACRPFGTQLSTFTTCAAGYLSHARNSLPTVAAFLPILCQHR